jgi:hypothetical protein
MQTNSGADVFRDITKPRQAQEIDQSLRLALMRRDRIGAQQIHAGELAPLENPEIGIANLNLAKTNRKPELLLIKSLFKFPQRLMRMTLVSTRRERVCSEFNVNLGSRTGRAVNSTLYTRVESI